MYRRVSIQGSENMYVTFSLDPPAVWSLAPYNNGSNWAPVPQGVYTGDTLQAFDLDFWYFPNQVDMKIRRVMALGVPGKYFL
jgi:hypothetical protein